ncbi:hypothetical protein [Archangium lipolyticum]|uniref:hypothetical protein n=1 Tax=Archangium lipolyticum TaxID=2970465 RepID=UPI00214A5025|nr:hypothetical protein [Archangium lipolyticum]
MRKSGWVLAPLAAAVWLAGCRSTTCADLAAAYADVDQKARPCMERAPLPSLDPNRCEQNLHACADEDVTTLESQVRCYQRLGTCQPGQKEAFLQDISRCDSRALSNPCEAAIF